MKAKYKIKVTHKAKMLWYVKIMPTGGGKTTFTSETFFSKGNAQRAAAVLSHNTGWGIEE